MTCISFILSINSNDIVRKHFRLQERQDIFDFLENLTKTYPKVKKDTKVDGNFNTETLTSLTFDEFRAVRANTYAYISYGEKKIGKQVVKRKGTTRPA